MHQGNDQYPNSSVTCSLRYVVEPSRIAEFEQYARFWMDWIHQAGGHHHGYFLPSEGASNIALALFSFPSLALYEAYREASFCNPECIEAYRVAKNARCITSYERSFFRPLLARESTVDPS